MILVDSSVWIDFFTGNQDGAVSTLIQLIEDEHDIYLSEYILTEVLQGFRDDKEFAEARRCLLAFQVIRLRDIQSYLESTQIYRQCRKKGITIRKTADCLIAQTAIENDLYLLHRDSDFDRIAAVLPLKVYPIK